MIPCHFSKALEDEIQVLSPITDHCSLQTPYMPAHLPITPATFAGPIVAVRPHTPQTDSKLQIISRTLLGLACGAPPNSLLHVLVWKHACENTWFGNLGVILPLFVSSLLIKSVSGFPSWAGGVLVPATVCSKPLSPKLWSDFCLSLSRIFLRHFLSFNIAVIPLRQEPIQRLEGRLLTLNKLSL